MGKAGMRARHRSFGHRLAADVWLGALLAVVGCSTPQRVPPVASASASTSSLPARLPPKDSASSSAAPSTPVPVPKSAGIVSMKAARFPAQYPFATFANRAIEGWKVDRASDGSSVRCSFRATSGADAHYGGLAAPLPGNRGFRLTVTFLKGAPAVRSAFVTALNANGEQAGRWGCAVRSGHTRLANGTPYIWQFFPGGATPGQFWAMPGRSSQRAVVHVFLDVDPGQDVSFRIDKMESDG